MWVTQRGYLSSWTWSWPSERGEHPRGFKHARKWQPDIFQSSIIEGCSQNGLGRVTITTRGAIFGQPLERLFTVMAWDIFCFLRAKLVPVRTEPTSDGRGGEEQLLLAAWLLFCSLAASFIQQLSVTNFDLMYIFECTPAYIKLPFLFILICRTTEPFFFHHQGAFSAGRATRWL